MQMATVPQFVEGLRQSGLLAGEALQRAEALAADAGGDAQNLARTLVRQELLSRWQAGQLLIGRSSFVLGKYKLLDLLGKGGMGAVYLAEHTAMNRRVAIKLLSRGLDQDVEAMERFLEEARAAAALDHPNIVRAYSVDNEGERFYLVMEFVDGRDLGRIVENDGPMDYADAAEVIRQAAEGLAHAHGRKLVHCDIKPTNLILNPQGVVKILDMGLARLVEHAGPPAEKDEGDLGTVDYMAPEQGMGGGHFDHRADIYALGCTLYYLLCGQPPFAEGTITEKILKHQNDAPPPITDFRPDAPKELVRICRKMMAKNPAERYQSADEVAKALRKWNPEERELKRAVAIEEPTVEADAPFDLNELEFAFPHRTSVKRKPKKPKASGEPKLLGLPRRQAMAIGGGVVALLLVVGGWLLLRAGKRAPVDEVAEASRRVDELFRKIEAGTLAKGYREDTHQKLRQRYATPAEYAALGQLVKANFGALRSKELLSKEKQKVVGGESLALTYDAVFERMPATIYITYHVPSWRLMEFGVQPKQPPAEAKPEAPPEAESPKPATAPPARSQTKSATPPAEPSKAAPKSAPAAAKSEAKSTAKPPAK